MCRSGLAGLAVLLAGALAATVGATPTAAQAANAPASAPATIVVRGTVVDDKTGEPVVGANIAVEGVPGARAQSNDSGGFVIRVADLNGTLVVSRIGFTQTRLAIGGRALVTVRMTRVAVTLGDVVVVGYGTQKRTDLTGSVTTVTPEKLENKPNVNVLQAIEGSLPGVAVTTGGAGADQTPSIQVRGRNSISASSAPLVVVDGIPFAGSLSDINPSDVAAMTVLKDASSVAIYGTRGANGVILITSKQGTTGKPKFSYNGYTGAQRVANVPDLMNAAQFAAFKCVRVRTTPDQDCATTLTTTERANLAAGVNTDWVGEATHVGQQQQHDLAISGGSEGTKYYLGGSALDVNGVARNDEFKRFVLRANLDQRATSWLRLGTNTQVSRTDRGGAPANFTTAFFSNPLISPYAADGSIAPVPWADDPATNNALEGLAATNDDIAKRLFTSNYLELTVPRVSGLSYRLNAGIEASDRTIGSYYGRNTSTGLPLLGRANRGNQNRYNWTLENVAKYTRAFGRHTLDLTGLLSRERQDYEVAGTVAQGFPNDVLGYRSTVPTLATPYDTTTPRALASRMLRVNYGFDERYLATFTTRRDGASVFGANNKYGTFPSVALAWNASNERFFPWKTSVDFLKVRASVGKSGNSQIPTFLGLAQLDDRSYLNGEAPAPGYIPVTLGNPNLKWESRYSRNLGLDLSLWKERVNLTVDAYRSRSEGLLLRRAISSIQGITSIYQNIGKTENNGIEAQINTINWNRAGFEWRTDVNVSRNRNRILDLYGDGKDDLANGWFIGKPIDVNYGYQFQGIWQVGDAIATSAQPTAKPGDVRIADVNGDGVISVLDRTFIGSLEPDYTAGLTNTFRFRRFSLSGFLYTVQGVTRANPLLGTNQVFADVRRNTVYRQYWTAENPSYTYPANSNTSNPLSVPFYEDASFVRLKDVTLSYEFSPSLVSRVGGTSLRLYVDGRNLWTKTRWSGLDPELSDANQRGIPLEKSVIAGLTVGF
jgi:TonB-linked SusC/RagA family outer membrane protein